MPGTEKEIAFSQLAVKGLMITLPAILCSLLISQTKTTSVYKNTKKLISKGQKEIKTKTRIAHRQREKKS
jgi:hypothetical protein